MTDTLKTLFDLTGRVAIVTGGSRGLGFQIAAALGEYGAVPVIVARKQAELDQAVATLADRGITAYAFAADLSGPDAAAALGTAHSATSVSVGRGASFSTAAVMMPSVPSAPTNSWRRQ